MSNFFDNLTRNPDALKNAAGGVLSDLGGMGRSVMDSLGKNNMGGLLGAGAVGGLLGALLGKGGRDLAGTALTLGGTAVAGTLAWNFYKKWSARNGDAQASSPAPAGYGQTAPAATGAAADTSTPAGWNFGSRPASSPRPAGQSEDDNTADLLLEAMVYAARADGHIDETERSRIDDAVRHMFPNQNVASMLNPLMERPIDPRALAGRVRSPEQARDLYRLSCAIIDTDQFMERSYLNGLAEALGIEPAERDRIEAEVAEAKRQGSQQV